MRPLGRSHKSEPSVSRLTMPRRPRPWSAGDLALRFIVVASCAYKHQIAVSFVPTPFTSISTPPSCLSPLKHCQIPPSSHEGGSASTLCSRMSKPIGRPPCGALWMVAQEVGRQAKTEQSRVTPPPFSWRKLGSFEKMLTQTRDGVGPAEEGVRTLLTPHVWVSNKCFVYV